MSSIANVNTAMTVTQPDFLAEAGIASVQPTQNTSLYPQTGLVPSQLRKPIDWQNGLGGILQKFGDVNKLDQAEKMAQDAFAKASNPNASYTDKLWAKDEMDQANQLRRSVEKDLDGYQQQALEHIIGEEQNGLDIQENPNASWLSKLVSQFDMQDGAKDSQSLDKWILS